jgi:hypothetical protein
MPGRGGGAGAAGMRGGHPPGAAPSPVGARGARGSAMGRGMLGQRGNNRAAATAPRGGGGVKRKAGVDAPPQKRACGASSKSTSQQQQQPQGWGAQPIAQQPLRSTAAHADAEWYQDASYDNWGGF